MLDLVHHLGELIDPLARVIILARAVLGAEMAPLKSVHRAQVAFAPVRETHAVEVFARAVAFPDVHALGREDLAVRTARHEPQQLLDHAAREDALGSQERQGRVGEGEAEGGGREEREGARAGSVGARLPGLDDPADEVEVLVLLCGSDGRIGI